MSAPPRLLATDAATGAAADLPPVPGVSPWRDAARRLRRHRPAMAAAAYLAALAVLALLTPLWPLQPPQEVLTARAFAPPTLASAQRQAGLTLENTPEAIQTGFGRLNGLDRALLAARFRLFGGWTVPSLCGTDKLGRDLLARLLWGARVSLLVGLVAAGVSLVIGVTYGATSGYLGGWIDNVLMRAVDVLYSIPFIFVVIFVMTILGDSEVRKWLEDKGVNRLVIFYLIVGAIYWLTMARVVRGQVLSLKNQQFVEAARALGSGTRRIIFRHLVPNLLGVVIVYLTLTIPQVMLFEAFLSFLGLGVSAPDVSWGLLANEGVQAITSLKIYWWLVLFPSLALGLTLLALNVLGDALRDALDPRLKNR